MALYDSADCVRRAKLRLNRPAVDEAFTVSATDDVWYDLATEAQDELIDRFATYNPDAMWPDPAVLSTADLGLTYTFGTDTDGANIFALGRFRVYLTAQDVPDFPLTEGVDYTIEGTKLRMPNAQPQSFADGGPYVQFVAPGNVITSATQPTVPKVARRALISLTAAKGAERLRDSSLAAEQQAHYENDWNQINAAIKTQGFGKGGPKLSYRERSWWRRGRL